MVSRAVQFRFTLVLTLIWSTGVHAATNFEPKDAVSTVKWGWIEHM